MTRTGKEGYTIIGKLAGGKLTINFPLTDAAQTMEAIDAQISG